MALEGAEGSSRGSSVGRRERCEGPKGMPVVALAPKPEAVPYAETPESPSARALPGGTRTTAAIRATEQRMKQPRHIAGVSGTNPPGHILPIDRRRPQRPHRNQEGVTVNRTGRGMGRGPNVAFPGCQGTELSVIAGAGDGSHGRQSESAREEADREPLNENREHDHRVGERQHRVALGAGRK